VKQEIAVLEVQGDVVDRGSRILLGDREVGTVTSTGGCMESGKGLMVMGYLDRGVAQGGVSLEVGTAKGAVPAQIVGPEGIAGGGAEG